MVSDQMEGIILQAEGAYPESTPAWSVSQRLAVIPRQPGSRRFTELAFARNYERLLALKRTYDPDDVFHSTIGHITPTEKDSISLFQPAREIRQVIK